MVTVRTIRRYPNRRLYDTSASRYITLTHVRQLVRDRIDFVVVDCKTDEDITKPVLLQVIVEEERRATPLLSRGLILQLIRAYGNPIQNSIAVYLEQSLTMLLAAKGGKRSELDEKRDGNDLSAQSLAHRNFEHWRALQDEIYRALSHGGYGRAERAPEEANSEASM